MEALSNLVELLLSFEFDWQYLGPMIEQKDITIMSRIYDIKIFT